MSTTADNTSETGVSPADESNRSGVSFSNDVEEQQAAYTKKSSAELRVARDRQSLSASAKAWDLDGDGELDDAELALRNLDKSHKGTLSKDQMYQIMSENLQTQRELFKVKKVVIGLVVFTCVLALSNLGTSFAAAFLAKDTTTNNDELVDAKSGETLETENHRNNFVVDSEFNARYRARQRHLCNVSNPGGGQPKDSDCTATSTVAVPYNTGRKIAAHCYRGHNVGVTIDFPSGSVLHPLCGTAFTESYPSTSDATQWLTNNRGNSRPKWVTSNNRSVMPNADESAYVLTGFESGMGEFCDVDADCAADLSCHTRQDQSKVCLCANHNACPQVNVDGIMVEGVCAVQKCGIAGAMPTCTSHSQALLSGFCPATDQCAGDESLPRVYDCTTIPIEDEEDGEDGEDIEALPSVMNGPCTVDADCAADLSCYQMLDQSKVCLCANHNACPQVDEGGSFVEGVCAVQKCGGVADAVPTCTSHSQALLSGFCPATDQCAGDESLPRVYDCTPIPIEDGEESEGEEGKL